MADITTRHDRAPVKVGATPIEVRANGAKVYEGTAAFGDIVKRYPDLRPPRNEFIPAEEAMSPAALASLKGAVFTAGPRARDWDGRVTLPADHPSDLTTPETVTDLIEGAVIDAWRYDPPDGGYPELKVKVIAYTRAVQGLIESGTCDLSLGMATAEDWTPGVGPRCGTPFQCIQRSVMYDHLNVVDAARSRTPDGRTARLDQGADSGGHPSRLTVRRDQAEPAWAGPGIPGVVRLTVAVGSDPASECWVEVTETGLGSGIVAQSGTISPTPPVYLAALTSARHLLVPADDLGNLPKVDSYPRHGESHMNPEVLALIAKSLKMDALSAEDAALLAQMSPEAQAAFKAAAETGTAEGAAMAAESSGAASLDAVMTELAALRADLAALKAAKMDAPAPAPAPAPAAMQSDAKAAPKKDAAAGLLADPEAVIAAATRAAAEGALKTFNDAGRLVGHVRKDGHASVHTTEDAVTVMLATVAEHLPVLKATAESYVKAQRLDALRPLYDQAEALRRAAVSRQQAEDVGDLVNFRMDAADGVGQPDALPMFSMPIRRPPATRS